MAEAVMAEEETKEEDPEGRGREAGTALGDEEGEKGGGEEGAAARETLGEIDEAAAETATGATSTPGEGRGGGEDEDTARPGPQEGTAVGTLRRKCGGVYLVEEGIDGRGGMSSEGAGGGKL